MNHPKHEELVPYLFGEAKTAERRRLKQHLRVCPECRDELAGWRRSLKQLDARKLPPPERPRAAFEPALKWALAAAVVVVLGAGFAIGRLTSAAAGVEKARAAIEPRLRQEFAQMLRSELERAAADRMTAVGEQAEVRLVERAEALAAKHEEDTQAIYAALARSEAQHLADYIALKQDVDTLAVNTDAGLRLTEQQLVQLADATSPTASGSSKE
jgi:hypothetical protein